MKKQVLSTVKLPNNPGVYFFRDKEGVILYIGKATSLRDRVRSYFNPDLMEQRGLRLVTMVTISDTVTYQETGSVLEALLLESKFIKKHNPVYNAKEKDNKSFTCVVITKENFPRVLTMRIREYEKNFSKKDVLKVYGPFASLTQLREAMKIIRKLFPYRDRCLPRETQESTLGRSGVKNKQAPTSLVSSTGHACFNAQIKLCPGVCIGAVTQSEYKNNINNIRKLFEGKKIEIKRSLKKQMDEYAKKHLFEKAGMIRNTLFALDHIKDIHLIKEEEILSFKNNDFRFEAYDVAHIGGYSRVGVMTVIVGKEKEKNEYRKFKLPENINDDYEGLREILTRRFSHKEWQYPDLIVIDGGKAHKQVAEKVLASLELLIPCVSVVKDERHKPKDILGDKIYVDNHKREILLSNAEAHRFAISYHKTLRNKVR